MKYAAFLRGVNVGGKVLIKMSDLKKLLEKTGLKEVRTVLASGNVVFESPVSRERAEALITTALSRAFDRDILVIVRTLDALKKLQETEPFKGIEVTQKTRLYVTFLAEKPKTKKIVTEQPGYKILKVTDTEMLSHLEIIEGVQTPDLMKVIDNALGKKTTMRNWNTVQKILKA
jgi:uncharacterized protein (DUF1697 family)